MNQAEAARIKGAVADALAASPFRAPLWLRNGHAQTLYPHLFRHGPALPLVAQRWPTPDDDELAVYHSSGSAQAPRLVLFHGLEGNVSSSYVQGLLREALTRGWPATVMEHRSCDGRINRARRLYHSGETTDLALVVERLARDEPGRPLVLVGFSLGANQLLKWLGESGERVPAVVVGAAAVSPPFDLLVSGPHIDRALFGAYSRHFLRTLIPKATAKAEQFPGCLDAERVRRAKTFREFDTYGTAALHGFVDALDYWQRVSCGQFLPGIRVPTLSIAAADDPFNPGSTLPRALVAKSPYLVAQFTAQGGHVGFVTGTPRRPRYWAEAQIMTFGAIVTQASTLTSPMMFKSAPQFAGSSDPNIIIEQ